MKLNAPSLAPILRSDAQGRMLALLFADPDEEFSITDIAERTGISIASVLRDAVRLTSGGYLAERRVGRSRLVHANRLHPLYEALRAVVHYGYGPAALLPAALRSVVGIESAYVYGSWAARYHGEAGADPQDIDLLVIGDPQHDAVFDALAPIEKDLRREVNVTFLTPTRWGNAEDGFVKTVRERPLVEIL